MEKIYKIDPNNEHRLVYSHKESKQINRLKYPELSLLVAMGYINDTTVTSFWHSKCEIPDWYPWNSFQVLQRMLMDDDWRYRSYTYWYLKDNICDKSLVWRNCTHSTTNTAVKPLRSKQSINHFNNPSISPSKTNNHFNNNYSRLSESPSNTNNHFNNNYSNPSPRRYHPNNFKLHRRGKIFDKYGFEILETLEERKQSIAIAEIIRDYRRDDAIYIESKDRRYKIATKYCSNFPYCQEMNFDCDGIHHGYVSRCTLETRPSKYGWNAQCFRPRCAFRHWNETLDNWRGYKQY